ncbi:hypothetical protein ACUY3M_08070 [Corynebacterium suicordis]|uniref:hypothetical protein n=1 Tax=uncultured Corynebacterium sp. TaxID=159447 RepID=UPI00259A2E7E|nr:hypothetical protein [uncultured Corynebacterium sp.]
MPWGSVLPGLGDTSVHPEAVQFRAQELQRVAGLVGAAGRRLGEAPRVDLPGEMFPGALASACEQFARAAISHGAAAEATAGQIVEYVASMQAADQQGAHALGSSMGESAGGGWR